MKYICPEKIYLEGTESNLVEFSLGPIVDDQNDEFEVTFKPGNAEFISSVGRAEEDIKLVINTKTAIEGNYTVYFVVNETIGDD